MRAMTTTTSPHTEPSDAGQACATMHDAVACAAYRLYTKHGSQDGHDVRNWLDAEVLVKADRTGLRHAPQIAVTMSGRLTN